MKLIEQSIILLTDLSDPIKIYQDLERIGRTAYKSENLISDTSHEAFLKMIKQKGHLTIFEHLTISFRIVCSRGISHELVRHRLASFTQESTRYCNYSKDKFGKELTFIKPSWMLAPEPDPQQVSYFVRHLESIEHEYFNLLELGLKPEEARDILPNALKTELVMTANLREWQHIIDLRTALNVHPDMQRLMHKVYHVLDDKIGLIL